MPKMHTQKVYTWLWCSSETERNDGQTNLAERNVVEIGRETTVGHGTGPSRLARKIFVEKLRVVRGQDSPNWWNLRRKQVYPRARMVLIS
jgi:hypothetical protein